MNHCLSRKALFHLYAGDGTVLQKVHLRHCSPCAKQYEELSRRLLAVERVLQQPPPFPFPVQAPLVRIVHDYRVPVIATVLVTVLLVMWGSSWFRKPGPNVSLDISSMEVLRFFETDVSRAVFAAGSVTEQLVPTPVSDTAYIEAALTDSWPCEQRAAFGPPECDVYPFPLPVKNQ